MNKVNNKFILIIISFFCINLMMQSSYAHHHHHHSLPPKPIEKRIDKRRPQQTLKDIDGFSASIVKNIQTKQGNNDYQAIKKDNHPVLLLPNHYTRGDKGHLNANQGWVNSKRQRGHHDIGINAPLPQTADPTQNKTHNVFRRAMPIYEPNY